MSSAGLLPPPQEGRARASRFGVAFGPRFFLLLAVGLMWLGPALLEPRFIFAMLAWDLLAVLTWAVDLRRLPNPATLLVRRTWLAPAAHSVEAPVQLTLVNQSRSSIRARILDAVPDGLRREPPVVEVIVGSGGESDAEYRMHPRVRGRMTLGDAYVRYRTPWQVAERWAIAPLRQDVVIYPNLEEARREALHVSRSREADRRRRSQAIRGAGRTFESLREYQVGDEVRDICWTASARRAKLVTRTFEVERSQPIWIVIDAGRLMRTRVADVTKLDRAVNAALTLSQVALASGDRVGLIAYGRRITHYLPAARGSSHLRQMLNHLAEIQPESSEADHWQVANRLRGAQKRRGLIVWITDVPDAAMTPEVVQAAARLVTRHLVLFVVLGQPDLNRLALAQPATVEELYHSAAAQEVVHRREVLLARLRAGGALALEVSGNLSPRLVNAYLEVKQRGRL